tara:strand:+ start:228 stop:437 length:210 start_codon:yes stop_codon:yes gene_type:complete
MSFFLYVNPADYEVTEEDMLRCCYDEVVAEAKDTGDFPMYGEAMLRQSAKWKLEEFKNWMRPLFYGDED